MHLIEAPASTDPAFNLAMEEQCLLNLPMDRDYLLLYVNGPIIVVGKHQNAVQEINTDIVEDQGIPVHRRISGGGTVYHDEGNLNFSIIRRYETRYFNNYSLSTGLVAEALRRMGVPAGLNGRGDILVDGRKVSGNAQAVRRDRMVSHGTLLFRSRLDLIGPALHPKPGTFTSHGRPSVRSAVANIGDHLPAAMTMAEFRAALLAELFRGTTMQTTPALDLAEQAEALATDKYRTWEWNYGRSPDFSLKREKRIGNCEVGLQLRVEKGRVAAIGISGDLPDKDRLRHVEQVLHGVRYRRDEVLGALTEAGADKLTQGATPGDWARLVY